MANKPKESEHKNTDRGIVDLVGEDRAKFLREQFQNITKPKKLKLPDFNSDDPQILYDGVNYYRTILFLPELGLNISQWKAVQNAALRIRADYPDLPNVPEAVNLSFLTEQDFIKLEQWFLTAIKRTNTIPTLTEDEANVLDFLYQEFPQIRFQEDIASACKRDRKTIGVILNTLLKYNLITRPRDKQKGYVITPLGRDFIEEHFSPKNSP